MSESTNVGSIVANLKIDSSDWTRELAQAEAKANQLGRANPTIRVDADTAGAVAQLGAAEAAEKKVSASSAALTRMREQGRAVTVAQVVTQREATKSTTDLESRTRALTDAVKNDTVAKDRNAESNRKVDSTAKQAGGSIHLLYSTLALLAPAAVPIAGVALAAAGALGAMGVAGMLAVVGVKKAMQDGTQTGDVYAAGIGRLKTEFLGLAETGAEGAMDGFNRGVDVLDSYMPTLNAQMGSFSRVLGNVAADGLTGILGAFTTLDPVIRAFAGYLGDLSEKFSAIGSSNGLKDFGDYALSALPQVMATIESLVTGVGNLLTALTPLGGVALNGLKLIGDILAGIPTDVLTLLVSGALGAYSAFSAWQAIIPVIQSFGFALNMSLGPIGLIVAGVGALIGVMAGAAASTQDATAATMGYTAALERDKGIIGDSVRAYAAQEIAKSKAADAAEKLGISLDLVTSAALGEKDAITEINDQMQDIATGSKVVTDANGQQITSSAELGGALNTLRDELGNQSGALRSTIDNQRRFKEAMGDTTSEATNQVSGMSVLAGVYGTSVAALSGMEDGEKKSADQLAKTTLQMQMQNDAGGLLKQQLDLLSGKTMGFQEAQNAFERQLISATKQIKANGTAINGNSEAAVNNRGSLLQQVQAAQASAEAYGQLTGKSSDATTKLQQNRDALIKNATAAGMNKDEVTKFVDAVMKIPAVKPTKIELEASGAIRKAEYLKSILDGTNSKTIYLHAETSVSGPGGSKVIHTGQNGFFANGGMVNYLADGGFPRMRPSGTDTVPAMLTPGEIVMRKSSVDSIGASTLLHANRTGQLPAQGGGGGDVIVYIGDEAIDGRLVRVVRGELAGAARGSSYQRGGAR